MRIFKTKLLEFIDELLVLFKNNDRTVYTRLIYYHHQVKNKLNEDELHTVVINFLSQDNVREMISTHNYLFTKGTPLETDVNLLWQSCTANNKVVIWKWVEVIINAFEPLT